MFIYPSNTALTFHSHSYSLQKMYRNTFQILKLPKCEKGPTTSHLLTASGRFKTSMATLQENFDIKTIQELKNGYCVQYAESSIVEIGEIMCLNLTQKQK